MPHFKDMTFCPSEFACLCEKGNTCDRAWNAIKQAEAEQWMENPPVCFFAEMPSCMKHNTLYSKDAQKYHHVMHKVHRMLDRYKFKGKYPNYTQVKYLKQRCGFSVYEIGMTIMGQWHDANR
jgi:hypothetical protein